MYLILFYADLSSNINDNCNLNIKKFTLEVLCMCSDNFQIILMQTSDYLNMKYLHAFRGSCNLSNYYTLSLSGNYWVTVFHENIEGIFQADILYSSAVKIGEGLSLSTLIEVNVTTSKNINIICKLY